ncbi:RNA polymerase sporulation sigma factor SigH [Anaerovorax odorimutans]|uniref:RNA polymerase sporulation sigma factor SigH n=1 Tax=Anaerovorax odorimutans TaxID=109327 RepID=UPI00041C33FC|nr:RNA polymerase sporulation sigma factor SigH [Anaerovorax odorimutans]
MSLDEKYKDISDEDIVLMARQGNEEAEEYLIRKYKDVVRSKAHAYFMVGADNEDIVQEGMIGIFRAIKSFNITKQTSFKTFAEICINRQIITAIKRATRLKHSPLNMSVSLNKPIVDSDSVKTLAETLSSDSNSDPEALYLLKEDLDYIEGKGSDIFSDLELRVWNEYLHGKTYIEIAEITGKSPKAIDNAIQRTKRKLEHYLVR